ncbi:hypothetical protein [Microvirga massiliensis]|uniref:hypothetical protein n=1 Tax=Microvirga massiliensis TaxID=1033741 RepID=UPI00062B5B9B|nr:hypothetical protein [Microvirga massiliensis]
MLGFGRGRNTPGRELAEFGEDERFNLLQELGVRSPEVAWSGRVNTQAYRLLSGMMQALDINPSRVSRMKSDDLSQGCLFCPHARRCSRDLADGSAARTYMDYCPNAKVLQGLCARHAPVLTPV